MSVLVRVTRDISTRAPHGRNVLIQHELYNMFIIYIGRTAVSIQSGGAAVKGR